MRPRRVSLLLLVLAGLTASAPSAVAEPPQAQLVDRIAAIVDGEVITLAQVDRAARLRDTDLARSTDSCAAAPGADPDADARMLLDCMIDGLLMFQHVRRFPQFDVPAQEIEALYQQLIEQFGSRRAFEEELARLQLTPAEVRYDLERQALIGNYIDLRYRDVLDIGETALQSYYDGVLRPEMERRGAPLPPFEAVDDELIEPILIETEVNRRVDEWIADLRRRADITVFLW